MTITSLEIYPYRKGSVHTKRLRADNIHGDSEILEFTHENYLELFDEHAKVDEIVSKVLLRLMKFTDSKEGFLALVEKEDSITTFRYYCAYIDIAGVTFKSDVHNCKLPLTDKSLLTRSVINQTVVISNDVSTDPRSMVYCDPTLQKPQDHPNIKTFLGIPLFHEDVVIGQLGLANAESYKSRTVEKIMPLERFFSNFIYLWSKKRLTVTKELELKKEVLTLKDSFIATMSHEIRTPLNGIVGMARLLSEADNLTDKQETYLKILAECSTQLMELVNDILDYSKMTAGGLLLNNHPFNLKTCITKAVDIVSQRSSEKGLELIINVPSDLPENVTGDSRRLKQVLFNLLTNAIKFTDQGSVTLSASYEDIPNDELPYQRNKKINFEVADTGIGIKPADQKRIFEVFTKINKDDRFYTNTTPGAGMGLSISKYIVESMGGELNVSSDGKTGTTFNFYIILDDETDLVRLLDLHGSEIRDKTAIIVDDTEDNRIFLMDALYSWNIQAVSFSSGREALSYMGKRSFDLAIVDLCMPNMSGLEMIQTMREKGYKQPVIGLSSIGSNVNGQEWFDHFATKPISKSKLFNLILRCFINKPEQKSQRKVLQPPDLQDLQILIAEDDHYNQILLVAMLETLGYKNVTVVSNGKLCVAAVKKGVYDVCLMDIKMPVMDGLEATKRIKKMRSPPTIIAVSASVLDSDKNHCYAAGVDGYIAKPIQKEQLAAVLKSLVSN